MWPRDGIVVPCRCRRALRRRLWQEIDISTDGGRSDQDGGRSTQGAGQPGSQAEARTVGVDQDACHGRSEGKAGGESGVCPSQALSHIAGRHQATGKGEQANQRGGYAEAGSGGSDGEGGIPGNERHDQHDRNCCSGGDLRMTENGSGPWADSIEDPSDH